MSRRVALSKIDELVDDLVGRIASDDRRFLLGIAGPPGAGKSTVAAEISILVADRVPTVIAPMDGFHRSNDDLEAAGLLPLKGIPETFDAAGFVSHLERVRTGGSTVAWPAYDRGRQETVPGAVAISSQHRLVVVEGNYLLLDQPPWDRVAGLLDEVWYLEVAEATLVPRLLHRQRQDRTESEAARKVASTDLPNAALVAETMRRASVIVYDDGEPE